jgi:hypothetical protein
MCGDKNKKNLLLGVVALCARMRTSTHTSPMLRINYLIPTSPYPSLVPYPNYPLHPTETTHVTHFNDRGRRQRAGFFFSPAQLGITSLADITSLQCRMLL